MAGATALAVLTAVYAQAPVLAQAPIFAPQADADAFAAALARDAAVAGLEAEVRAAEIRARSFGWVFEGAPSASLSYRSDQTGSGLGAREYEAEIGAPIWLPGERGAAQLAAAAELAALRAQVDLARLDVAMRVREAAASVRRAEAALAIAERVAEDAAALVAATRRLTEAGEAARADLVLAEAAEAEAMAARARAQADLISARARFRALTGADDALFVDATPAEPSDLDAHPLIRLRLAERDAGDANARRAALAGFPSPEIGLLARRERGAFGQDYDESVGVRITVPLGRDPGTGAAAAQARAQARRAEAALTADRASLEADIAVARAQLAAAEAGLIAARVRRDRLNEALAFTTRAQREGETGFIEVLRARTAAAEAERALALADIDRDVARGALAQALGILP
jgi:cobalt-zinc-cadmium efflux system outer membrane protein